LNKDENKKKNTHPLFTMRLQAGASIPALFKGNSKMLIMWPTMLSHVGASVTMASNAATRRKRMNAIKGKEASSVLRSIAHDSTRVHSYKPSGVSSSTMQKAIRASEAMTNTLRAVQGGTSSADCLRMLKDAAQLCTNVAVSLNKDGSRHSHKRLTKDQTTVYGMVYSVACILPLHIFTHTCDVKLLRDALKALRALKSTSHYVGALVTSLSPANVVLMTAGLLQNKQVATGLTGSITNVAKSFASKLKGGADGETDVGLAFLTKLDNAISEVQKHEYEAPFADGSSYVPSAADIALMSSSNSGEPSIRGGGLWSDYVSNVKSVGKAGKAVGYGLTVGLSKKLWGFTKRATSFVRKHWTKIVLVFIVVGILGFGTIVLLGLWPQLSATAAWGFQSAGPSGMFSALVNASTGLGTKTTTTSSVVGKAWNSLVGNSSSYSAGKWLPPSWGNIFADGLGRVTGPATKFVNAGASHVMKIIEPVLEYVMPLSDSIQATMKSFFTVGNNTATWLMSIVLVAVGILALVLLGTIVQTLYKLAKRSIVKGKARITHLLQKRRKEKAVKDSDSRADSETNDDET
jgi:hypothetical protein